MQKDKLLANWERHTNLLMAVLGILYLVFYVFEVVFSSDADLVKVMETSSTVVWIVFALDLIVRLTLSDSASTFVRSSWLEAVALAVPFMRILRVFRVLVAIRGLRPLLKNRMAATGTYLVFLLPLTWFIGAVAVLDVERSSAGASITNLPDALWWSLATITTVGYGELYPTTFEGKFVAAVLMVMGIALFSAGAGMFASWILGEKRKA